MSAAVFYWQAAIAAAKREASAARKEADLKWLREHLARIISLLELVTDAKPQRA